MQLASAGLAPSLACFSHAGVTVQVRYVMAIRLGLWTLTFWEKVELPLDPQKVKLFADRFCQ